MADGARGTDRPTSAGIRRGERRFLAGKIATARFYAEHVLPEAGAWQHAITVGAASTLALEDTLF